MLRFGVSYLAAQIIALAGNRVDTLVLGLTSSPSALGFYNRAYQLAVVTPEQMRAPLVTVALPGIQSRLEHPEKRLRFVLDAQLMLLTVFVPALLLVASCAPSVVEVVLGPGWRDAAPLVSLLAVGAVMQQAAGTGGWLFLAAGAATNLMRFTLVSALVKVVLVLVGHAIGPVGVAAGLSLAITLMYPVAIFSACRSAGLSSAPIFAQALRVMGVNGLGAVCAWGVLTILQIPSPILSVGAAAAVIGVANVLAYFIFQTFRADLKRFGQGAVIAFRRSR